MRHVIGVTSILIIIVIGFFVLDYLRQMDNTQYNDGVYYNQSYGYHSDILVKVTIKNQRIEEVLIVSHEEPKILADVVFNQLPAKMVKYNTANVDIVSGATYTSKSLIEAVDKALLEALKENNN